MATIWIIGMMGAGKTTVAPLVAARLEYEWVDTDRLVESRTGMSVVGLFGLGESSFRSEEAAAVRSMAGRQAVVACGGGIVLDDALVETMRGSGFVVWLDAPVEILLARTIADAERPLLSVDPEGALQRILEERRWRYEAAAHATVSAGSSPDRVAEEVIEAWSRSS